VCGWVGAQTSSFWHSSSNMVMKTELVMSENLKAEMYLAQREREREEREKARTDEGRGEGGVAE
jgi:hypothetical protein